MVPTDIEEQSAIAGEIQRFLKDPDKPIILALSRPDARKNIGTLIAAFGESDKLRKLANLVIIVGNRDDITDMVDAAQEVLVEILLLIDRYDLYGQVAYPKHHTVDDVPLIYRLAAATGGVFVNPALTEPFGLTLLEAAACGLPLVATEDGGPRDIIENCGNGVLIDPQNTTGIADAILQLLSNREKWEKYSTNGLQGVRRYYSWDAHVERYLKVVQQIVERDQKLAPVLRTRPCSRISIRICLATQNPWPA